MRRRIAGDQIRLSKQMPIENIPSFGSERGITHFLTEDLPEQVVSDRMNVDQNVLDKYYSKRSEEVKIEQQRGDLDNI